MNFLRVYWPTSASQGHLRLASERAFSAFFVLAGLSGLGITIINLPYLFSYPLTVGLGGFIALLCLTGPIFVVGADQFERKVRVFAHTVAILMLVLSLAAREMVSPSNLLFIPAVLTTTLALGWRDGLATLVFAVSAFLGTFVTTGPQWAVALPNVNIVTLIAGQFLAASFVFAGSAVFRRQMVYAARELQQQTERAEQANLSKSNFLANVSHEIRTPLNGVLGMARILEDSELRPDQQDQVRAIAQSGELLLTTLNDVLDLSRIEAGHLSIELRAFDLHALVGVLTSVHQRVAEDKGIGFTVCIAPALDLEEKRVGDENRIAQILHNLLSNAVKFTAQGAVELTILPGPTDSDLQFQVRDSGIGMSAEQQSKVFDKFVQADQSMSRKYGGSGLGLSIVSHLVDLMQGEIRLDSELGEGSLFTVLLPLPVDVEESSGPIRHSTEISLTPDPDNRELRILVVDDVSINRKVMNGMLGKLDYEADYADSGEVAVQRVAGKHYDIVFLDISMPGMNGYATLEKIREIETMGGREPATVIAQTANVMRHQLSAYEEAGFDGALGKPVLLEQLQDHLQQHFQNGLASRADGQ